MTQPSLVTLNEPTSGGSVNELVWVDDASQYPTSPYPSPTAPCLSTLTADGPLGKAGTKVWTNTPQGLVLP